MTVCYGTDERLEAFSRLTFTEWTEGSGIAGDLFELGVDFISDLEIGAGGEAIAAPIHEALGWTYSRFRHRPNPNQFAALLYTLNPDNNWEREVFQAKLASPIFDAKKGKHRKYESPKGFGVRGGFAPVSDRVWWQVARNCRIAPACPLDLRHPELNPSQFEFWAWVEANPVPITVTEGFKKAQCLLSTGRACIALSGITMGVFNPYETGKRLRPYLQRFANRNRPVFIAFDAETKPKTIRDVARETRKLGRCFADAGCQVRVIRIPLLPGTTKTGIDDYGVAVGPEAIARLYADARDYAAWLWHRKYRAQRSRKPSLELHTPELELDADLLPNTGILALESCKGSGKTNSIRTLVKDSEKVLLLTHRICLGRSLAQRLDIAWKSDADRANGSWIVDGTDSTLRLGLCVDSMLSIDPNEFRDGDLVIDEADQVFAHLLTSSTCNRDGRRPALLARLNDLIRAAKRVIIASADLTDAELDYCERLRDDGPAYLVRNTFVPDGYPVTLLDAPNKSVLVARLLEAISLNKRVFVATDAKSDSKAIVQLVSQIEDAVPDSRVLLINSDTSGGEEEIEFIRNINERVTDYDVAIATPSMATGVSIEVEHFDFVFGLFTGVLGDGDIAQALARVRAPIPRIVWCAKTGKNYSRASKAEYPPEVREHLLTRWDKQICLIRSSLRPDLGAIVQEEYDFNNNPHLDLWANIVARTNGAMWILRAGLLERLKLEGNRVDILPVDPSAAETIKKQIKQAREQTKQAEFEAIAERGRVLSETELHQLQSKESRTPEQLRDERKTQIAKFYCLEEDNITAEMVRMDDGGRLRGQILELEALLEGKELAISRDSRTISRQAYWQKGLFLPDQSCLELRRQIRELLHLNDYLDPDKEWSSEDLDELCDTARKQAKAIESCLGYRVSEKTSNGQIFRALLAQLGVKCRTRFVGPRGEQEKLYRIDAEHWDWLEGIVQQRRERDRQTAPDSQAVSTPLIKNSLQEGVDTQPVATTVEIGSWVSWLPQPEVSWMVKAVERGICFLKGLTGSLNKQVPLGEVVPMAAARDWKAT